MVVFPCCCMASESECSPQPWCEISHTKLCMLPPVHEVDGPRHSRVSAVLCILLLIFFVTSHFPTQKAHKGQEAVHSPQAVGGLLQEEIKDKIMFELSNSNEKLEVRCLI